MHNSLYYRLTESGSVRHIRLHFLIFLYAILDGFVTVPLFLKSLILTESFFISGMCQSSGQCCSGIMLYVDNQSVDTVAKYQDLIQKKSIYTRFKYNLHHSNIIESFQCSKLSVNNKCLDYANRPDFCRAYPYSYFLERGQLKSGCGYKVCSRVSDSVFWYSPLRRYIQGLKKLHSLID